MCLWHVVKVIYVVYRFATLVAFLLIVLTVLRVLSALSGCSKGYISLMHPLLILCLSFGEVPMRFRSGSDEVPMEIGGKCKAITRQSASCEG